MNTNIHNMSSVKKRLRQLTAHSYDHSNVYDTLCWDLLFQPWPALANAAAAAQRNKAPLITEILVEPSLVVIPAAAESTRIHHQNTLTQTNDSKQCRDVVQMTTTPWINSTPCSENNGPWHASLTSNDDPATVNTNTPGNTEVFAPETLQPTWPTEAKPTTMATITKIACETSADNDVEHDALEMHGTSVVDSIPRELLS